MKIVIDYLKEKERENYYNHIVEAVEACQNSISIKEINFINFPITEVDDVLKVIKDTTNNGIISISDGVIVFVDVKEPLKFKL